MSVFQFFSTMVGRNGTAFGFSFEHPAPHIDAFVDELNEKGIVSVDKLKTVDDGKGRRMIIGRERYAIGKFAVSTISNPSMAHWEPED